MAQNFRLTMDKFKGLHECEAGESRLLSGESPRMKNLLITDSYTLMQREGWRVVCNVGGEARGLFSGNVAGVERVIFVLSDKVYLLNSGEKEEIGTLESTTGEVSIFSFNSKVYFLDGVKIKVWDGEEFGDLKPYVPLVLISCDHQSAGTAFEDANMLTGTIRQQFSPDGTRKDFRLLLQDIDSVDSVKVSGEVKDPEDYTVNLSRGIVNFSTAAAAGTNTVEITYTKSNGETAQNIHRMRYAVSYGGDNDTRIFLWGDPEYPSHIRYSGVFDGISGMEYFPENNFNRIGSGERVTSLVRHYDKLLIFSKSSAYIASGTQERDVAGIVYTSFPTRILSSDIGCATDNFATLIDNSPVTLTGGGLYRWSVSGVRDERNAKEFGERIRQGLRLFTTEGVSTFDREGTGELYIYKGNSIYVYNYRLDVFYYYEGICAHAFCETGDGEVYFLTPDGKLCVMCPSPFDGEEPIEFVWESGYEEFLGLEMKNIHSLEFQIFPLSATSFDFVWISERMTGREERLFAEYRVADFSNMAFDSFSFATAVTPVRIEKRIKSKRTRGFKLVIKSNGSRGDFHLISVGVRGARNNKS